MKLLSIVITSYNQGVFLSNAIKSVRAQKTSDVELIIIDDGSTDNSLEIIKSNSDIIDYWSTWENKGQSQAINEGIFRASGKYVTWLCSDDLLSVNFVIYIFEIIKANNYAKDVLIYGGYNIIDNNDIVQEKYYNCSVPNFFISKLGPNIILPGTVFSKLKFEEVGGFDDSLLYCMDLDLWMKLFKSGVKFIGTSHILSSFRTHPQQKGHTLYWLEFSVKEEFDLRKRFNMAARNTVHYKVLRYLLILYKLFFAKRLNTLLFRLFVHSRLRMYNSRYS